MSTFKKNNSLAKRKKQSNSILTKYPDKIPIIVEKNKSCKNLLELNKNKYLVSINLTLGQFLHIIREKIKIKSTESIFFLTNNICLCNSELLITIYNTHKNTEDNFLYLTYTSESVFG